MSFGKENKVPNTGIGGWHEVIATEYMCEGKSYFGSGINRFTIKLVMLIKKIVTSLSCLRIL